MSNHIRYLDIKAFCALLADLRLTPNVFQDRLLEFLERVGMVEPIARIDWPRAMVIEGREATPHTPPTEHERTETEALSAALRQWDRYNADPALAHPLDALASSPGASLVTKAFSKETFRDWSQFNTLIEGVRAKSFEVPDAVDTYYHAWQALLVADALEMGVRLVFDTRDPGLLQLACAGDLADLPQDQIYAHVSFDGPRGLRDGLGWTSYFDAAARLEVARGRKLTAFSLAHGGEAFRLSGEERNELLAFQKANADAALAEIGADRGQVMAFVVYLCERWDQKTRRGQGELAGEYKRQLGLAARLALVAYDLSFKDLAQEIGRVTGHFADTLDVIFPDWAQEARERAELSLKASVIAQAPSASLSLTLSDADAGDLLDWLERNDQWRVHLAIETMLKHQFSETPVDHVALAKEVETLATTLEHLVNALLREAQCSDSDTLMRKLGRFWKQSPGVDALLAANRNLTNDKAPFADQLVSIAAISSDDADLGVAQTLLSAVLYRNTGQHAGMENLTEEQLHEAARIMLTAMLFCRRNLLASPPLPE